MAQPKDGSLFPRMTGRLVPELADDERDTMDAYWTPPKVALACTKLIPITPHRILEPSVGGGAWVDSSRKVWRTTAALRINRCDMDPTAPGLYLHRAAGEVTWIGDFFSQDIGPHDLILGNPPYGGDIVRWFTRSLQIAPVVGFLLRNTVLGSMERFDWWQENRPAFVYVLKTRPKWGGPGARKTTDKTDSIFVLWIRGQTDTRLQWLDWDV